ncbi:DUF3566 domain-containing protein [Saccharothrix sp. ST-888]|uniref:DUF3566 domain-containing protein n=1 Tax=Saccharothrix sp. ST-888 TaxID=1427391 RepID=UPI0009E2096C|nr:DUF3566 domain-containing protein [Saccharothrix sp. ST-888]
MSGATGAAGGAASGLPGAAQGGAPFSGVPQSAAVPPASSTSVMPSVGGSQGAAGSGGFSTPTTYAKGQPSSGRATAAPRRPAAPPTVGPAGQAAGSAGGRVRKARLRITKADPWSVMKVSFLLSLAVGVIIIVATAVLWMTLDGLGVFDSLGSTLKEATGADTSGGFNLMDYVGFGRVMIFTTLIAVVDVVLMTALATLSAFIYNTAAGFTGGIELTLAEED